MRKKALSLFLVLCMVFTMLPISAMAEESNTAIGKRVEIIGFAPLTETEKTVMAGTSIVDLELPESLTATVRTGVIAGEEPVQDSGDPNEGIEPDDLAVATTGSAIKAAGSEWEERVVDIPVKWTSNPEYDMDAEGRYVFTPVIEGYSISAEMAELPQIVVMVEAAMMQGLLGSMAVTEGVAQTNGVPYSSLQGAFNAVQDGGIIELLQDITLESAVNISNGITKSFTLDLKGKILDGGTEITIMHEGSGILIIKDTIGNGKITTNTIKRTIHKKNGQLKVENTLLENTKEAGGGQSVISAYQSEVFVSNSVVKSSNRGINLEEDSNVYLSNTDVESKIQAIHNNGLGSVNISGGTIESTDTNAIWNLKNGKISISGNARITSAYSGVASFNKPGTIYLEKGSVSETILEITGGTIENTAMSGYGIYNLGEGKISIPSGSVVIKAGGKAMNKAPDLSGNTNVKITASANVNGTPTVPYEGEQIATYKYLKFEPAPPSAPMIDSFHNITNDTTPTFTGSAEPGSTVTITSSLDGDLGTTTADSGSNWSITSKALTEGTHSITAIATNDAVTSLPSSPFIITIDTTRPTATIGMSRTELYSGDTALVTITFSEKVTGFDNSDLTVSNGSLTEVTTADDITFTATVTADDVNAGTNAITLNLVGVEDLAGNSGSSTAASPNYTIAIPATVPGAPTNLAATPGNGQLTLTWTAPDSNGGSAITGYEVSTDNGTTYVSAGSTSTSYTVTGLTNGTSYTVKVRAVNAIGEGVASTGITATPAAVPGAPTNLAATPGNGQLTLTWEAPTDMGGSPISGYEVSNDGGTTYVSTGSTDTRYIVTDLTNGTSCTVQVRAVNSIGEGAASTEITATPATVPGAPTNLVATLGNGQLSLTWEAPTDTGGSAITSYEVSTDNGSIWTETSSTSTSYTVTGLTNGTSCTVKVRAVNAIGGGAASTEITATPATVPGAPTNLAANPGNGQLSLTWEAPTDMGGSSITGYEVSSDNGSSWTETSSTSTSYIVTGLTNGTSYTVKVRAVNAIGGGTASTGITATPAAVPGAPTSLVATPGNGQLTLTWEAPTDTGGSSITGYEVSTDGGATYVSIGITSTGYNVTGLTNGTSYTVKVRAVNAKGEGVASTGITATPAAVPGAPTNLAATPGNGQLALTWEAPTDMGGSSITSYEVSTDGGTTYVSTSSTDTTYTVTGLTNGTNYTVKVRAVNAIGEGTASTEITATPAAGYTITLDPNGGKALTPSTLTTGTDGKLTSLPVPTRIGSYSFKGWFTAASGGTAVTTGTVFSANITIYAQWTYSGGSGGSGGGSSPTPSLPESTPMTGQVIDSKTGAAVQGINAQVSTAADGTAVVQLKSQEAILFKLQDGTKSLFSDVNTLGFTSQSNEDAKITMTTNGNIKISNLASNTQSKFAVQLDLGNNRKVTIGFIEVKVDSDGKVTSISSTLIDPYGTIIDATTGQKISDAHITLYYADTERNKQNGNAAHTRVDLPLLDDFKPNNNKNPQYSDQEGFYAFMVFPNADYYLVATKEGYENYKSMTISVEQEIVKWDFKMNKPLTGVQRLAGYNRVDTALAIAKANYTTKLQNAILTTANNYPDALAGSVLAYKLNAPILLVDTSEDEQKKVMDYLKSNLNPSGTVYILGGTGAVGQEVEYKIIAAGFTTIKRISGNDGSETALKIAEQLQVPTGRPIILVNEGSYADALSISSSAAAGESPILLVGKNSISDAVRQKIAEINPIKVYLIGGEAVISSQVANQAAEITGLTSNNIIRLAGEDRYATSLAVAKHFNLSGQSVSFATGKNFPDALAGGVFAANNNSPILLVDDTIGNDTISYLKTRPMIGGIIFGGESVLGKKIEQELSQLWVSK